MFQCCRRDDKVVVANHIAGYLQFCPKTSMFEGSGLCVGKNPYGTQNGSKVKLAFSAVALGCSLDAVPQLGDCDGCNLELLIGL